MKELLPKVEEKIKESFKARGLPVPKFKVILEPALVFNRQTTDKNLGNSQAKYTWEWSSTILLKQDNSDSGHRLNVGYSDRGGAGNVDNGDRGSHYAGRGFRLAVVLNK